MKSILFSALLAIIGLECMAQPWKIDSSFADFGIDTIPITGPYVSFFETSVALRTDTSILISSTLYDPLAGAKILAISLLPSGALNSSFGQGGLEILGFGGYQYDGSDDMALQNDDKTIHAGYSLSSNDSTALVIRLNEDGTPDPTFGDSGIVLVSFGGEDEYFQKVVIQPDGRIIAAGQYTGYTHDVAMMRLNQDGSPDTSFANIGYSLTHLDAPYEGVYGLLLVEESKILLLASNFGPPEEMSYLLRFDSTGVLDTSFGNEGILQLDLPDSCYSYKQMVMDHTGRILLATQYFDGTKFSFVVTCCLNDGTLDLSFGNNGHASIITSDSMVIPLRPLLIEDDNDILVGVTIFKQINQTYEYDPAVIRLTEAGILDSGFGINGMIKLQIPQEQRTDVLSFIDEHHFILTGSHGDDYVGKSLLVIRFNDFPVGIPEPEVLPNELSIFPNPCETELNIRIMSSWGNKERIRCFSAGGTKIFDRMMKLKAGINLEAFSVAGLPSGNYFIQIGNGANIRKVKFVVTHVRN